MPSVTKLRSTSGSRSNLGKGEGRQTLTSLLNGNETVFGNTNSTFWNQVASPRESSIMAVNPSNRVHMHEKDILKIIKVFFNMTFQRVDQFERLRIAAINSQLTIVTADNFVMHCCEILFGSNNTLVFQREKGSLEIYGTKLHTNVSLLSTRWQENSSRTSNPASKREC